MSRQQSLQALKSAFFGLDTQYPLADGRMVRRRYLDSSASTLMMKPAYEAAEAYLAHYANTHTTVHTSAHVTYATMHWAYDRVLSFVGADKSDYVSVFSGSGATAVINRLAAGLAAMRPEKDLVLVSTMEHHSNDLPHRAYSDRVIHIPLEGEGARSGQVDLDALETLLREHEGKVNYLAVAGVSNVTGVMNPLADIATLAHKHDAYLLVDGAQMVAHVPVNVSKDDIDFLVFSGHKTYAPGSPGALVAKSELLHAMPPHEVGGGMVSKVTKSYFHLHESLQEREQAGTPNIFGAITLACVLEVLDKAGMDTLVDHEKTFVVWATEYLRDQVPSIRIYGDLQNKNRVGSIAFNLHGIGHGLVAAILNDYHGIAVRNECFCAHPFVHEMLLEEFLNLDVENADEAEIEVLVNRIRGMVRASFGLYTQREDIQALATALKDIEENIDTYRPHYNACHDGSYRHKTYNADITELFDMSSEVARCLENIKDKD